MYRHRWRHGWKKVGRPAKPRVIETEPRYLHFVPLDQSGNPIMNVDPVVLYMDEYEAYRLVYLEGLTQEEAAKRMGISRGTLWRCLDSARRKIALMLSTPRPLIVIPGPSPLIKRETRHMS